MRTMNDRSDGQLAVIATAIGLGVIVLLVGVIVGCIMVFKTVGRYQSLADARNRVKVSSIEIRNQEQRIQVARQKAEIRHEEAKGVREAQDEIAKTLTPLYVQFEMVEALKAIATSGQNNTVVYIPSGANGIPLVSTVKDGQVGQADG